MKEIRPLFIPGLALLVVALLFYALVAIAQAREDIAMVSKVPQRHQDTSFLTTGLAATPQPTCVSGWNVVESPNPSATNNLLKGVAAVSANDMWAVGSYSLGTSTRTLIEHWNGQEWRVIPSPNPAAYSNVLFSVTALSVNDVWAVGYYADAGPSQTLVLHWNGQQWWVVTSPNMGIGSNALYSITAISIDDAWAVGRYYDSLGYARTLILHWDGQGWSVVPSPSPSSRNNQLYGVAAISATDVWAVGLHHPLGSAEKALILHWDGTQWAVVPNPDLGPFQYLLRGVAAIAPNDVWAVGYDRNVSQSGYTSLIEHWDGAQWTRVSSPNPGTAGTFPSNIAALSNENVWAVGYYLREGGGRTETLTLNWDGKSWVHIPSPSPANQINNLEAVTAIPLGDAWSVGDVRECLANCRDLTLVERYTNPCFAQTPSPTVSATHIPVTPTETHAPTATPTLCAINFTDVHLTDYFYQAVRHLYCLGAISGYDDGTFRPYWNTTRGQLCKIVVLAEGFPIDTTGGPHFVDVLATNTFYPYIETAYNREIISGYSDGTFRWGDNVTRGQLCKIVVLAESWMINTNGGPHFYDVSVNYTFYPFIETAFNYGIISGYSDGSFRPGNAATRGQIAKIVHEALRQPILRH